MTAVVQSSQLCSRSAAFACVCSAVVSHHDTLASICGFAVLAGAWLKS